MSDTDRIEITVDIPGDWWYLAGALTADLERDARRVYGAPDRQGYSVNVYMGAPPGRPDATVAFRATPSGTAIHVIARGQVDYWQQKITFLGTITERATAARQLVEPSYDEVIERYYRARAAGGRTTLRQLAQDTGLSYSALRIRKMEYDRAGGWGSKTKQNTKTGE